MNCMYFFLHSYDAIFIRLTTLFIHIIFSLFNVKNSLHLVQYNGQVELRRYPAGCRKYVSPYT